MRPHILLADDDPDDCFIFSEVAKDLQLNLKVTCLEDCESLLKYLDKTKTYPDLIFLDLNMPKMTGQQCLRKLKSSHLYSSIPIVVYSTASQLDIAEECYQLGASLYVIKPNDGNKLADTIRFVVNKYINYK